RVIAFDPDQVEWLTGMQVTRNEIIESLRALGFEADEGDDTRVEKNLPLTVTVPTWRGDVEESADLVEEVARIVGFDRIPSLLPTGPLPTLPHHDTWFERETVIRDILVGAGLIEVMNYTLTNRQAMARLLSGQLPGEELLLAAPVAAEET